MSYELDNLEKKYLYLPMIMRRNCKYVNLDKNPNIFDKIFKYDKEKKKIKFKLRKIKENTIKFLFMENKEINEKWKKQSDYNFIVKKILENKLILRRVQDNIKQNEELLKYNKKLTEAINKIPKIKKSESCSYILRSNYSKKINLKFHQRIKEKNKKLKSMDVKNTSEEEEEKDEFLLTKIKKKPILNHKKSQSLPLILI